MPSGPVASFSIRPVRDSERTRLDEVVARNWGSPRIASRGLLHDMGYLPLNSRRLWLVTTNDNVDALRFYQIRGMHLVRLWIDAETEHRKHLKPEIPLFGDNGIPIRDELELELTLTAVGDPTEYLSEHRGDA